MALLASFIGIDKYADIGIRDLSGARRDATALWALFSDTIPSINADLVVDSQATIIGVRKALDNTLGAAGSDDTVVVSFAGHGTRDHRLVLHDTNRHNLSGTTIPVEEIAEKFKRSSARAILFILDCCFSGGAPARVLEDSPIPRNPGSPLVDLSGEGRILLSASSIDEPAYEHPSKRHGLLTHAIMEVLQAEQGSVDVLDAVSRVMESVRAEANRIGVNQTPVLFGSVKSGVALPCLRPGQNFFREFPEAAGVKISGAINELSAFGLPDTVLNQWSQQFNGRLNDLQTEAVNEYRILGGKSLLVIAPTSSGKTFIGEMAAIKAAMEGRKAIFLFPYRALTSEKYEQFYNLYSDVLGMRIIRCTGDYVDQTRPFIAGKYDIALLTYEMFLNLAVSVPSIFQQLGLVVVDEAQFIADHARGINVELLLTYLLAGREKGINPQLIVLSAVIGNVNNFDAWLGCNKLITDKRPIPLIEGVLDRTGMFQFIDTDGTTKREQLLLGHSILQRRDKPSAQDVIVPLVQKIIAENKHEKVIIFRNQRGTAEGAANYLAEDLGLPSALETLSTLPNHDLSTTSAKLRKCLEGGTAFHNTNLTREEKTIVERVFRDTNSKVRVLGATTTLAAGINTPASTVVIAEQEFVGDDGRTFTVAEYKNMAGRAGRIGFQETGKAIILVDTTYQREQMFQKYVLGKLEPLHSSFDPHHMETWIIRLLAQVERVRRDEVTRLLANTYGGYIANQGNPKWREDMFQTLDQLMKQMIGLKLVEQELEYVQLTLLGRACGRSSLAFRSAMRLVELLQRVPQAEITPLRLMALIQAMPELDDTYIPMLKNGTKELIRQREAAQRYGDSIIRTLQSYVPDNPAYLGRCKRASILWDWVHGHPVETIEERYSTTPYQGKIGYGDIRKVADTTRFHLRSAFQIINIMFLGQGLEENAVESLLKQLEIGLPGDCIELLTLPLQLERGEYLALYHSGIKTSEDLWAFSPDSLKQILSSTRCFQLEQCRPS